MKTEKEAIAIGRVTTIYRYPVKSMRGQKLEEAEIGWHGILGDRRYAFVKTGNTSHFPWLTGREIPPMLLYTPSFSQPTAPLKSPVLVKTPQGRELELENPELLAELEKLYGQPAHLVQSNRGNFDDLSLSMITTATLETLGKRLDSQFQGRNFRQNIVIENFDSEPFAEESWLGKSLLFGEDANPVQIWANERIKRCMMINLDPETAVQNPAVLREVVQHRENCLGIFGTTQQPGLIKVGDLVRLVSEP